MCTKRERSILCLFAVYRVSFKNSNQQRSSICRRHTRSYSIPDFPCTPPKNVVPILRILLAEVFVTCANQKTNHPTNHPTNQQSINDQSTKRSPIIPLQKSDATNAGCADAKSLLGFLTEGAPAPPYRPIYTLASSAPIATLIFDTPRRPHHSHPSRSAAPSPLLLLQLCRLREHVFNRVRDGRKEL